jgi:hypothetical protein
MKALQAFINQNNNTGDTAIAQEPLLFDGCKR